MVHPTWPSVQQIDVDGRSTNWRAIASLSDEPPCLVLVDNSAARVRGSLHHRRTSLIWFSSACICAILVRYSLARSSKRRASSGELLAAPASLVFALTGSHLARLSPRTDEPLTLFEHSSRTRPLPPSTDGKRRGREMGRQKRANSLSFWFPCFYITIIQHLHVKSRPRPRPLHPRPPPSTAPRADDPRRQ